MSTILMNFRVDFGAYLDPFYAFWVGAFTVKRKFRRRIVFTINEFLNIFINIAKNNFVFNLAAFRFFSHIMITYI